MKNDNLSSSTHSIKLQGCGGPRFHLYARAEQPRNLLNEADLATFREVLPTAIPAELKILCNRDDWHEMNEQVWKEACEAFGECTNLTSFEFSTPFCRPGYQATKMQCLVPHMCQLMDLTIQDGLYSYAETFMVMSSQLNKLESLVLKNSSYGVVLDHQCCEAMAHLICCLPKLKKFELSNVKFESQESWTIILEALLTRQVLEDVTFYKFTTLEDSTDFATLARRHSSLVENLAVSSYLVEHFSSSFTVAQRLEAVMHVRSNGTLELSAARLLATTSSNIHFLNAVNTISDRLDLTYQFLRHETDPTMWACF